MATMVIPTRNNWLVALSDGELCAISGDWAERAKAVTDPTITDSDSMN